ncbi:hypothetical protein N7533_002847 [Penicillium manginii]|uniref:uncharacterized protein n=1 Tax=Penicillium manginii TaxID=203109 RepID=UPI002547D632|nr:uncharacterized protein N7533_002847 [Penicillium manginii]KAJ5764166.1 hypothetical protein N7533_002847 [Penicillium manginii]
MYSVPPREWAPPQSLVKADRRGSAQWQIAAGISAARASAGLGSHRRIRVLKRPKTSCPTSARPSIS